MSISWISSQSLCDSVDFLLLFLYYLFDNYLLFYSLFPVFFSYILFFTYLELDAQSFSFSNNI